MCSAWPSSRGRPQIVKRPSVVKATGVFGSTGDGSVTTGTSTWKVHCFGSVFLFVAHCPKCSVFVSSLSTRILPSGTEQLARLSLRLVNRQRAADSRAHGGDALADLRVE